MDLQSLQASADAGSMLGNDMAVIQQAISQHISQNPESQGQVFMIQPIMITSQEPDGSIVQQTQYQIISQSGISLDENNQVFQPMVLSDDQLDVGLQEGQFQLTAVDTAMSSEGDSQAAVGQLLSLTKIGETLHVELMTDPTVNNTEVDVNESPHGVVVGSTFNKTIYKCDVCPAEFSKLSKFKFHLKSHEDETLHRCPKCPMAYNFETNLRLHLATHNIDNPVCPECGKKFSRIASFRSHLKSHEKEEMFTCTDCGEEFTTQIQLERHEKIHRNAPANSAVKTIYACRQCHNVYDKPSLLREHMRMHFRIKSSLVRKNHKRDVDRSAFPHQCKHCSKSFQKPSQLERHIRIHTGERPFKCQVCNKAFNQKGALQMHFAKHTGSRPFECEFCPSAFSQKGNLRAHIERVHAELKNDESSFYCDQCSCVFRKLGSLNSHLSRVHSEMQEILVTFDPIPSGEESQLNTSTEMVTRQSESDLLQQALDNSGVSNNTDPSNVGNRGIGSDVTTTGSSSLLTKSITTSDNALSPSKVHVVRRGLVSTMAVHDSVTGTIRRHVVRKVNGVRWHQCVYCTKEFKKPSDVVRHVRIHTHEKPYKCPHCFRSFAVKSTLTAHVKTHSGIKEFKCDLCYKMFSTQGSLKVHQRLHTGAKPFHCLHCDKLFRTSGHCKSHTRLHFRDGSVKKQRRPTQKQSDTDTTLADIQLQEPILITDQGFMQVLPKSYQMTGADGVADRPYKCSFCSRGFKKSSHLKQHVRSHTGEKPYRCVKCLKSFVSSGVLKAHIRTHGSSKDYCCSHCNMMFTTNGSMRRHMTTHSEIRPFMCPYCQKTFKTSVNCKKHMKTHRQEIAMQQLAGSHVSDGSAVAVTTQQTLNADGGVVDASAYMQEVELIEVSNANHSDTHLTHLNIDPQQIATLVHFQHQVDLDHELGSASLMAAQNRSVSGPAVIHDFQNVLVTDIQLQNAFSHQELTGDPQHNQNLPMEQSQQPSESHLQLQQSLHRTLLTLDPGQTQFNQMSFGAGVEQFEMHVAQASGSLVEGTPSAIQLPHVIDRVPESGEVNQDWDEGEPTESETVEQQSENKLLHACNVCNRVFKKVSHLKQHFRSHTGEKPFKCNHCGGSFVSNGVLKAHLKTHTGSKNFHCNKCQASFTTNGSLLRHMMMHNATHTFQCTFCPQTFRNMLLIKRHLKVQHAQETDIDSDGQLVLVQKAFETSQADNTEVITDSKQIYVEAKVEKSNRVHSGFRHKSTHSMRMGYQNQCSTCLKSFKKPSDLMRHLRIHTGEKPFQCDVCCRVFTVKSTLDSHMKTHGPSEKHYQCQICESYYSTRGSLKVHMRLHTGSKPFKCPHCDMSFRTSGHRKSHVSQHFKPLSKRWKVMPDDEEERVFVSSITDMINQIDNTPTVDLSEGANGESVASMGNHVINIDPMVPFSVTLSDVFGTTADGDIALQVMQGIERGGIHLQLAGLGASSGSGIQITGLDGNGGIIQQAVQIDSAMLQQLQQSGVNFCIEPKLLTFNGSTITVDGEGSSDQLQDGVVSRSNATEVVNPNVVMQTSVSKSSENSTIIQQRPLLVNSSPIVNGMETTILGGNLLGQFNNQQHDHTVIQLLTDGHQSLDSAGEDGDSMVSQVQLVNGELCAIKVQRSSDPMGGDNGNDVMGQSNVRRTHKCMTCGKAFKRLGHLAEHALTHTAEKDNTSVNRQRALHSCPECNKTFPKPSQLERHVRVHTGERPFVCDICKKSFNQKNTLQTHLRKHRGERPHQCQYCPLAFTQKGNLKTHERRAHPDLSCLSSSVISADQSYLLIDKDMKITDSRTMAKMSDSGTMHNSETDDLESQLVNFM